MSRLILIRHGETDYAGTFCGHMDPDLNAAGEAQAARLADRLASSGIQAVFSSDLCRARRTAEAISARTGAAFHLSTDLREIGFGQWEGLRWKTIESRFPQDAALWASRFPYHPAPGGEDFLRFCDRVLRGIRRIREQCSGTVCVVSHAGVMRLALTRIFSVNEERAWALTRRYGQVIEISLKKKESRRTE
ncbi:MAG TPA: histidine phosphatase family protein [Acidobacteriaceae bacterium]|nr:histidine phosphatase family protein [Acidobacteriaceae bacterium]